MWFWRGRTLKKMAGSSRRRSVDGQVEAATVRLEGAQIGEVLGWGDHVARGEENVAVVPLRDLVAGTGLRVGGAAGDEDDNALAVLSLLAVG